MFLLLADDGVLAAQVVGTRVLQLHDLLFVRVLLFFQRLNVLVAFLHLILAVVDLLLQLLIASLCLLEVSHHAVLGLLHRLQVTLEVSNGLHFVFELALHTFLLQVVLRDGLLLRKLRRVQVLVGPSQLRDLTMNKL